MRTGGFLTCFVLLVSLQLSFGSTETGPLLLTPLIESNRTEDAKNLSKVHLFKPLGINASAYSGYITVGENKSNNLFFLFIEAENDSSRAPLMLWTPGGPGYSALFFMLLQNGPVKLDLQYNSTKIQPYLSKRDLTIQTNTNVIYLDAPVGAGFSFTNDSTYPTKMEDVIQDITEFLKQFLKLFSDYKGRDFYAAGDSYAARYSVALADYMLRCPSDDLDLQFRGVIGGVGFLAPVLDLANSSDFLYQFSMLNKTGYEIFKKMFATMKYYVGMRNYTVALHLLFSTLSYSVPKTLFQNLTLYDSQASPLCTENPLSLIYSIGYVNNSEFKKYIHAGENSSVEYANPLLFQSFAPDVLADIREKVTYVLNNTRVLFYTGQMDALFPAVNLQTYIETLEWKCAAEYRNATRLLWRPAEGYYGGAAYTKAAKNFTLATVLGVGHYAGFDNPNAINYLTKAFLDRNISFSPHSMR